MACKAFRNIKFYSSAWKNQDSGSMFSVIGNVIWDIRWVQKNHEHGNLTIFFLPALPRQQPRWRDHVRVKLRLSRARAMRPPGLIPRESPWNQRGPKSCKVIISDDFHHSITNVSITLCGQCPSLLLSVSDLARTRSRMRLPAGSASVSIYSSQRWLKVIRWQLIRRTVCYDTCSIRRSAKEAIPGHFLSGLHSTRRKLEVVKRTQPLQNLKF